MSRRRLLLVGTAPLCRRLARDLATIGAAGDVVGWWVHGPAEPAEPDEPDGPILRGPVPADLALVAFPAAMSARAVEARSALAGAGIATRVVQALEDLLGPDDPAVASRDPAALIDRPPRAVDDAEMRGLIGGRAVLVTGAGGSIGSALALALAAYDPASLTLVDRSENGLFEIDRRFGEAHPALPRVASLADITREDDVARLFERHRPDVVFHAAAHKHVPLMESHPAEAIDNNLFGTVVTANAADRAGVERFVLVSTDKAVNPVSVMGATKRLAELYVQSLHPRSRTGFAIVRFGNVLATAGSVVEIWQRQLARGGPLTITHPEMTRYFMTLAESARLVIQTAALLDPGAPNAEVFLLDMGDPIRIVDLAVRFAAAHGFEARLPGAGEPERGGAGARIVEVVYTGIRPGEKLHEDLAFDSEALRPTRHPEINIWMLDPPRDRYMAEVLARLSPERRPRGITEVAALVREVLPEPSGRPAPSRAHRDHEERTRC